MLIELREQSGGAPNHFGIARHALRAPVPALDDETGALEHGDVLLHSGKRHVVARREVADRCLGTHDARQDVAAGAVGECSKDVVELLDHEVLRAFPTTRQLERVRPVYEYFPGWRTSLDGVESFEDLPRAAQNYVRRIEELLGVPVRYVSHGPRREQLFERAA